MKFMDITNNTELWEFMTTPSEGLVQSMSGFGNGNMVILGGSGKMGKELVGLVKNADKINGISRDIKVASSFSNTDDLIYFNKMEVTALKVIFLMKNF